ncbi:1-deoxy-D-xylulose 5-phosphate reductoisomerase [Corynebacterium occultum]|uniref:1-deoxy-D-xylulose 5-phosphate reductoisomerase n=1 Tax=Corynebacterium occultum TaxID=2675219 RepID=A0A6B8WMX3_9CORY|nr:1-deoxy-D-xylulose-5-phosphate reductoisomerase [Corynebacterium occultum]QGU07688.1 1-deoxy-D-xylulose 5-phosphate reductoisomerase [Corynebacterium occultum]
MSKRILILGSTGSIGTQALEVIADNPDKFNVVGIAAGGADPELIIRQAWALGLGPGQVAVAGESAAAQVSAALGGPVISGAGAAAQLVTEIPADTVLNALVGSLGLAATLAAIEAGEVLALANKESLVAGGDLVMSKVRPGQLIPVDSEHSAMAQCLRSGSTEEVARLVLTASGGPFRGWTREQMWEVTPEQAAAHPTWSMGQMNTLNSATLVNKGLELIEATLLFAIPAERVDVTVHPQSIIHSMVTFTDGGTIAQASPPSMKLPIAHALAWPARVAGAQPALDFSHAHDWRFEPLDDAAFPAVQLARDVATRGGTFPAVYNAANEEAAAAFLGGRIHFPEIVDIVAEVLESASQFAGVPSSVDDILATEAEARVRANQLVDQRGR